MSYLEQQLIINKAQHRLCMFNTDPCNDTIDGGNLRKDRKCWKYAEGQTEFSQREAELMFQIKDPLLDLGKV